MKSSSVKLFEAGIADPKHYRDAVTNEWKIPDVYTKYLTMYVIRETTPQELFFRIRDGILWVKDKGYQVVWVDYPNEARESPYLLISLRYCKFLDRGYALVKVLKGDAQFDRLEY